MRRTLWFLTLAALLTAALWVPALAAAKEVELTFWSWRTEDQEEYDRFIKVFESRNPGIKVKFIPYKNTEYNTILATALQGGTGPDVVHLRAYGGMEALANAGYLLPIDSSTVPELSKFPTAVLRGATNRRDSKVYGVPFALQTTVVLYNKTIFAQHGLAVPKTWDEFVDVARTLSSKGVMPFANGAKDAWTLEIALGAVGPNFYGANSFNQEILSGKATFKEMRFVGAMNRLKEISAYFPDGFTGISYTDMQMLFSQGLAGMFIGGAFELGVMAGMNPGLKIGVFPVPPLKAGDPAYVSSWVDGSYGINAATKNKEATLKFINFLSTQEYGQMFTDRLKQISAVPGTRPTDDNLKQIVGMLNAASTPYIFLVNFRYDQPNGSVLIQNGLQALLSGKQTAEQVADDLHEGLKKWFTPFQGK